ncbi:interferon-induced very large GTPase 1 [Chanos chanos]|uniref:Interferon-induced very large GTPase 1 n=1 Tax=Chanos chanos TaxID=29144 RepID=A0A6J2VXU3_CHACN|nr:interferon-induced very large GTPase 1-like [Chanos chanos]
MDNSSDDEVYEDAYNDVCDDEGVCTSSDQLNEKEDIAVEGVVPAPGEITVQSISANSVTLIWDPPDNIDTFELTYSTGTLTISDSNIAELENLNPGTEYTFSIASVSQTGDRSKDVTVAACTKPNPPEKIRTEDIRSTSVTLTWDEPATAVKEYHLTCNCDRQNIQDKTTELCTITFHNLRPGTLYSFHIATVHKNGSKSKEAVTFALTKTHLSCFLNDLGLQQHYTDKLSLSTVLQIDEKSITDEPAQSVSDLPWCFLKRLMMVNVTARSVKCVSSVDETADSSVWDIESLVVHHDTTQVVNPLDIVTALFLCSDSFLQQEIALKMSMCQFSVPLLLPNCDTQQSTFMLWAMRDIVKKFRPHSLEDPRGFVEERIVVSKLPLVSFVRLGECSLSKSQILNKLLSNPQQYHDTFVHHDMDCGDSPRRISNGLVEISWYLPCGNKNIDIFPEPVAVANLRGDISTFEAQYSFLCQTSAAVFVFFDNLDTNYRLLTNQHVKAQLFLVGNTQDKAFNMEMLKKTVSEMNLKKCNVILRTKQNDADFVKNLRSTVSDVVKNSPLKMRLEDMATVAFELGIHVDEYGKECQNAKTNADAITSVIKDTGEFKELQLPLQGKIWRELSKVEKEECRLRKAGEQNIETYKSDLQTQKRKLRQEQINCEMSEAMTCFISALSSPGLERSYFLKWMRMNLDNLSRKNLSGLRELYKEKCQDSSENKEVIAQLDRQISNSSLGTEHFLREMGQLYESAVSLQENVQSRQQMMHLPTLCAELLLDGFPLELVDGDASNIPLRWVRDVLYQLNALVQPHNKILVATVLGVQSTGKSTLLNTMFGVQFAVSSGRCTRGAFMLLIKVKDDLKQVLHCDFIVIIDTEGLKSPELAQLDDSYEHDNELATLVVGLSDVTIINIAMENSTEMKDILQIVVHAFLRMKEVGKKPKCQFVHQNVADVSAHDKNMRDRKILLEQLNEMTQAAAKMENKEENRKFTDVMEYDPETGNWYIPGLWHGNPPMAPVNAGYSEAVFEFKKSVVEVFGKCKHNISGSNILEFMEWTGSLWNAVKFENFIFSFRNSIVADAYMRLCMEFNKWEWAFKKHMYTWLTSAETRVSNFQMIMMEFGMSDMQEFQFKLKNEAITELDKGEKIILKNLVKYFEQKEGHVYLVEKYKEDFANSAKCLRRDMESSVISKLHIAIEIRRGMNKLDTIKKTHTDTMEKKVLKLLEKFHKHKSKKSDQELEKIFEEMWQETVNELSFSGLEKRNIVGTVFSQLRSNLKQRGSLVNEKLSGVNLDQFGTKPFVVTPSNFFKKCVRHIYVDEHTRNLQEMADSLIEECLQFISEKVGVKSDFNDGYIQEILHLIDERLTNSISLRFTNVFEIDLKLHICGHASREFQKMHECFIEENDPRRCLDQFKDKYCDDFKDLFNERDQCQRKAAEFANLCLSPAVEAFISSSLGPDIVEEMLRGKNAFQFSTRAFFQYSILTELLTESKFESYVRYICSYEHFVKEWILGKILENFSTRQKIFELEERYLKSVIKEIIEAITEAQRKTDEQSNIKEFIHHICLELREKLVIPKDALETIVIFNKSNLEQFSHWLKVSVQEMEQSLKAKFLNGDIQEKLKKLKIKPQDELFKRVFGCGKQCPFCKAPCEAGGEAHTDHCASIHRPKGLGRYRFERSEVLVTDICSSAVFSETQFRCYETEYKYHPYKKYREIFPDWHIPADPSIEASDYWKYVMAQFNQQFAKEYNACPADIPTAWKRITTEQAKKSLKESFSIQ